MMAATTSSSTRVKPDRISNAERRKKPDPQKVNSAGSTVRFRISRFEFVSDFGFPPSAVLESRLHSAPHSLLHSDVSLHSLLLRRTGRISDFMLTASPRAHDKRLSRRASLCLATPTCFHSRWRPS